MTKAPWANHPDQSHGRKNTAKSVAQTIAYGKCKDALVAAGDWGMLLQLAEECWLAGMIYPAAEAARLAKEMQ